MPLASTQYLLSSPLPPSARPDLAFLVTLPLPDSGPIFTYLVDGLYYEIPTNVIGDYTADATPGNRLQNIFATVLDGPQVWFIHSPMTQAPGTRVTYSSTDAVSTASFQGATVQLPLPNTVLSPGTQLKMQSGVNIGAGDGWTQLSLTVIRIPTGQEESTLSAAAETLPPTPQLV